jgi:predicted glycogen debranching enzyme
MLSLPGLALATKRFDDAREILSTFANHTKHGLVPNRFRDEDGTAEYNTVDASLWFCWAVDSYRKATQDTELVRRIFYPAVQQIIAAYLAGTDYNIHADTDGLISAGDPSIQLTWMDAKVGSWVVTPRHGKAVEIQALWYNALRVAADLAALFRDPQAEKQYRECATHVEKSFLSTFWFEATNCLADCVVGGHVDGSIRPNQIYALSLPYPLLTGDRALSVLKVVEQKLLTPVGLRSLDPSHPDYQAHYRGEPATRDGQYHQGTVWGFLLGAYLSAVIRLRGKDGLQQARKILAGLSAPLQQAGIGTLSEIYDGAEPHHPRGCIAQAWSIAEVLRVLHENPALSE